MTTIAFDGKTMAGDGLTNINGIVTETSNKKVFRATGRDGQELLVGLAGNGCYKEKLLAWLAGNAGYPTCHQGDGWTLMVWDGQELSCYYDTGDERESLTVPYAIGSGWPYAMTAMKMGADAVKAVEVAMTMDVYSGGLVTSLTLP